MLVHLPIPSFAIIPKHTHTQIEKMAMNLKESEVRKWVPGRVWREGKGGGNVIILSHENTEAFKKKTITLTVAGALMMLTK